MAARKLFPHEISKIKEVLESNGGLLEFAALKQQVPTVEVNQLSNDFDVMTDAGSTVIGLKEDDDADDGVQQEVASIKAAPPQAPLAAPFGQPPPPQSPPQVMPNPGMINPMVGKGKGDWGKGDWGKGDWGKGGGKGNFGMSGMPGMGSMPGMQGMSAMPGMTSPMGDQATVPGIVPPRIGVGMVAAGQIIPPPLKRPGEYQGGTAKAQKVTPLVGLCPICSRALKAEICLQCVGSSSTENMKPNLVQQVQKYKETKGEQWKAFCEEQKKLPDLELDTFDCSFLMKFLDYQKVKPDTAAPEYVNCYVALVGAIKIEEVLDASKWYRDGLRPVNIVLAFQRLAAFITENKEKSANPEEDKDKDDNQSKDGDNPPLTRLNESDSRVKLLVDKAISKASQLTAQLVIPLLKSIGEVDLQGRHMMPICEAASKLCPSPKPDEVAKLATAYEKILGLQAAPLVNKMLDNFMPMVKAWQNSMTQHALQRLFDLITGLLKGKVTAQEMYQESAIALAPYAKDLKPDRLAALAAGYATQQRCWQYEKLLEAIADTAKERFQMFQTQEITDIAYSFWSLDLKNEDLLERIGAITTSRLHEFNIDQLEKIECAYTSNGFKAPKEWFERSVQLTMMKSQS